MKTVKKVLLTVLVIGVFFGLIWANTWGHPFSVWPMLRIPSDVRPVNGQTFKELSVVYDGRPIALTMVLESGSGDSYINSPESKPAGMQTGVLENDQSGNQNGSPAQCEMGVFIFLDGVIQSYHTADDPIDRVMHVFTVKPYRHKEVIVYIDPGIGSRGDTLYLSSVMVTNPGRQPDMDDPYTANEEFQAQSAFSVSVRFLADNQAGAAMPVDIGRRAGPFRWGAHDVIRFGIAGVGSIGEVYPVSDGDILTVDFSCEVDKDYRIYLFVNQKPQLCADGLPYAFVTSGFGQQSHSQFVLDLSGVDQGEPMSVFAVAVPLVDFTFETGTGNWALFSALFVLVK